MVYMSCLPPFWQMYSPDERNKYRRTESATQLNILMDAIQAPPLQAKL